MEDEYIKKIEELLAEYHSYRRTKEGGGKTELAAYEETYTGAGLKWFPNPQTLHMPDEPRSMKHPQKDTAIYNGKSLECADELSDDFSKKIMPYVKKEIDKMDYPGSPIYEGLSNDALLQITENAYSKAAVHLKDSDNLESHGYGPDFSGRHIIKSLIRELIIKEIYLSRRLNRRF